ncbi:MAG TPA: hypothetical protein VEA60_02460, partial [Allosphingosinicella sp.]|nr:hypothetical protein [Allosphingosinicella sp.]
PFDSSAAGRGQALPSAERPAPLLTDHMPETVDPLVPPDPENAFTETRRLRHDGWTPERKRLFLERFAQCGIFVEACEAAGMSARAAYNLRDRDPLFAAGLDAASVKARAPLADEAYSRARNGVVERIYRDGVVVAEKHRYDNRLTMAVLTRLDSRIDRAEEKGAAHLALVANWDDYLDAVGEDRGEDALALLAPAEAAPAEGSGGLEEISRDHELHELHLGKEEETDRDLHTVWEDEDGWWTDYPPPAGFDGEEEGKYGDPDEDYRRRLSPAEQAVIDADEAEERAEQRARGEAQRDNFFGFGPDRASRSGGRPDGPGEEVDGEPG